MAITYELWDTETRNRIAVFESREAAMSAVRHTVTTRGRSTVETLLLGTEDDDGDGDVIARGTDLAVLAEAEAPATTPAVDDTMMHAR